MDNHWAESEPSRDAGTGRVEREDWLNPEIIPRRKGALLPEAVAGRIVPRLCSRGQGDLGGGGGPLAVLVTVLAKQSPRQFLVHISTWPA